MNLKSDILRLLEVSAVEEAATWRLTKPKPSPLKRLRENLERWMEKTQKMKIDKIKN